MAATPLLIKDDLARLSASTQIDSFGGSPVSRAFTLVAQEVVELLRQAHPLQPESRNRTEMIMIRAIEPEYREMLAIEALTTRQLEVLQLIVEGHNNLMIARKLHITNGTVKTHVRSVLRKLCVEDRTQAAIRALRSGLVH